MQEYAEKHFCICKTYKKILDISLKRYWNLSVFFPYKKILSSSRFKNICVVHTCKKNKIFLICPSEPGEGAKIFEAAKRTSFWEGSPNLYTDPKKAKYILLVYIPSSCMWVDQSKPRDHLNKTLKIKVKK